MISFIPPFESEHNFEIMSDYDVEENEYFNEGFFSIDKNDVPNFPESALFYYHAPFHSIYCDFDELIEKKLKQKVKLLMSQLNLKEIQQIKLILLMNKNRKMILQ